MHKTRRWPLVLGIILLVILVAALFYYFLLFKPNNEHKYDDLKKAGKLENPVSNLSLEQAKASFNEEFIFYLLYSIKAYDLHNPPLSDDNPRIKIYVDELVFNAEIQDGVIKIGNDTLTDEDIAIKTTREEAVLMIRDKNYIKESFSSGKSQIDLIASKSKLFAKGYLSLYTELTGKSVSGNVVRIYSE